MGEPADRKYGGEGREKWGGEQLWACVRLVCERGGNQLWGNHVIEGVDRVLEGWIG